MVTFSPVPAKAQDMLRSRPTRALITDFIFTSYSHDPHIPTVRGWIMDELERRDPEAYETWIDRDLPDSELYRLFHC